MKKLPSFVWVLIILAGVAALIGLLWGGFRAVTTVQWVGSVIALVVGWFLLRADTSEAGISDGFVKALVILIFVGIGLALDQPGNPVYNKPIEWAYCPAGSGLVHEVETGAARGGGVRVNQKFWCRDASGGIARPIGMFEFLFIRAAEYVVIGYVLTGLGRLWRRFRSRNATVRTG